MPLKPLAGKGRDVLPLAGRRINIWEGAVRSSKTVGSILKWVRLMRTLPPGNCLMVGKTERTLARNVIYPIIEWLGPARARYLRGSGEFFICGRRIYVVGAHDETSQEKIRGLTLLAAYVDEASLAPESFWTMLLSRLSEPGATLLATTNPDSPAHWLKRDYLDRASLWVTGDGRTLSFDGDDRLDLARFTFRLDDNPHLPADYVRELSKEYVGLWYRRFIGGEWVVAEGAVFDMWDPGRHVVAELPKINRWLGVGIDHGTANPFSAVLLGVGFDPVERRNRLYLAREWRHDSRAARRQMTDAEYSKALVDWLAGLRITDDGPAGVRPERVYYDPSAAGFGLQLYRDRVPNVAHANNDVLMGIRLMASLLASGDLVVHESCAGLLDELPGYCWDDKKQEKGEDAPIKVNDHSVDAARYAIASTEPLWRPLLRSDHDLAA